MGRRACRRQPAQRIVSSRKASHINEMTSTANFEIFLAAPPGLEDVLCTEVRGKGFKRPQPVVGGVVIKGSWLEVWRANLWIRGASRVLARIDSFHTVHLAQ